LARLADAMKDRWIAGTANSSYEVKGPCPSDFWTSADGTIQFDMKDGSLPHVSLSEDEGLKITRLVGQARLHAAAIEIDDAMLDSQAGKFQLSGTASLKGELDFKLARATNDASAAQYAITGTLAAPRVRQSSSPETQARLKADPAK
jgi:hypothetical protein